VLQVGCSALPSLSSQDVQTSSMKPITCFSIPECSASGLEGFAPSPFSKPYVMFSATNAASTAIDYSKGNVEDGVVDSPLSRGLVLAPIFSPSRLKQSQSTLIHSRSASPGPRTEGTPKRQLYRCRDLTLHSFPTQRELAIGNFTPSPNMALVPPASHSHGSIKRPCLPRNVEDRDTQSLSSQPTSLLSRCELPLRSGRVKGTMSCSYYELSLEKLKRQARDCAVFPILRLQRKKSVSSCTYNTATHSRHKDILQGMAKLKAPEMRNVEFGNHS
jgi:hypothetical protein